MNKSFRLLTYLLSLPLVIYAVLGFTFRDPKPDYQNLQNILHDKVSVNEINADDLYSGQFKSEVEFSAPAGIIRDSCYYGQEIRIEGNKNIDRIRAGITGNHICRVEIWNNNRLQKVIEKGFGAKMTWGGRQQMSIDFNAVDDGQAKVHFRFFEGSGFFGNIAEAHTDLGDLGNLKGRTTIGFFAENREDDTSNSLAKFNNHRVWKNRNTED